MTTHTPGPWGLDFYWCNFGRDDPVIEGPNGEYICQLSYDGLSGTLNPQAEDNARLILAACSSYDKHCGPRAVECAEADLLGELLEAARAAERALSGCTGRPRDAVTEIEITQRANIADRLFVLIAKATGAVTNRIPLEITHYLCSRCNKAHRVNSKIGQQHLIHAFPLPPNSYIGQR